MAEWKFGTVLVGLSATVMVIGRSDGTYRTTDGYGALVERGEWIGLTLANKFEPGAYGKPGDTTWIIDPEDWRVVLDE